MTLQRGARGTGRGSLRCAEGFLSEWKRGSRLTGMATPFHPSSASRAEGALR